ncbi:MAG: N-acetyltransferase [Actinobacteria bacterium]|nr:N-acetyltransferase [Actinomycetota bacterium]
MTESTPEITVTRNDEAQRYEIHVDGALGGFTEFTEGEGGSLVFPHTLVDPAFKGQGLGSILVGEALADTARRGEAVVPECPFVAHYLKGNDVPGLIIDWPETEDAADAANPGEPA